MKDNCLVTVVIPMFNAQKYIAETIDSVLNQTHKNFEIIIIDNHSTDKSREIVKNYSDSRIKLIELKFNSGGPARPRNVGIENAKGKYVAFLDADDLWLPDKLNMQLDFIQENNVNFTSCDCSLIDENGLEIKQSKKASLYCKTISKKSINDIVKNNYILTSSVLIEKRLLSKFNECDTYIAVEDFDLWLKILVKKECLFKFFDRKVIKYRVVENSASDRANQLKQELKANIVLANFIYKNPQFIGSYFYRIFFHLFRKALKSLCKKK